MTATTDLILERRRSRRRLTFWRVLAIGLLFVLAATLVPWPDGDVRRDQVARIWIDGLITADADREERLAEIAKNDHVKALVVRINSPGGTVVGSEALYDSLRRVAEAKPVVAVMSEVAASGGYIAALAADHVIAHGNTLTGSIGVFADLPNITGLLDMMGIEFTRVQSGPLKAEPSVLTEPAPGAYEAQDRLIEDTFAWFKGLVAERRGLEQAQVEGVADGRAFTGRQALASGLIDALGDERAAVAWLAETHGIRDDLRDWRWDDDDLPFSIFDLEHAAARLMGTARPLLERGPRLYALMR